MVRRRLVEVVKRWKHCLMISLTVDRELFKGPQEAYEYIRDRRGISVLMQTLRRKGFISKAGYVCVLEFQEKTGNGWPHWHILVESKYVPAVMVHDEWGKLRPKDVERVPGRPAFGKVDVSPPDKFKGADHAANYITSYLVKEPKMVGRNGSWISKAAWLGIVAAVAFGAKLGASNIPMTGIVSVCLMLILASAIFVVTARTREVSRVESSERSAERIARCGQGTILLAVTVGEDSDGERIVEQRRCIGVSGRGYGELCREAGIGERPVGVSVLERYEARRVWEQFTGSGVAGEKFDRDLLTRVPF